MNKTSQKIIIKTLSGLEGVLVQELEELGIHDSEVMNRAVQVDADLRMIYKTNYHLRTAIRILVPIREFFVKNETDLYEQIKKIDWSEYLSPHGRFAIDSTIQTTLFSHSHFISLKCKDAIADQFREAKGIRPDVDLKNPDVRINIHIRGQKVTVSLDSSGSSLHLRGYRKNISEAPLSEVLAAGMILLSGWDKKSNFVDFMCGSGTLLIEAGLMALNIAPGAFRYQFGFEKWKNFDSELLDSIKEEALSNEKEDINFKISGCDHSPGAIRVALENIKSAGLKDTIQIKISDFLEFNPPEGGGTVVLNPPYGERIKPHNLNKLYKDIGDQLKSKYAGYSAWILSSSDEGMKHIGLKPSKKLKLINGALDCKYYRYDLYQGSKKMKFNSEDKNND